MRLIDADKLHVDKQINGKCWISQEQIINAPTEELVLKALEEVKTEVEAMYGVTDFCDGSIRVDKYEVLASIEQKMAEVKGDKA